MITYSTVNKLRSRNGYSFTAFFIDRWSRIYTGFLPALAFVLVVDFLSKYLYPGSFPYETSFSLRDLIGNLFMLQQTPLSVIIPGGYIQSFGSGEPFWTVAVEWWIYLFFGWCVLRVFPQRGNPWVNALLLAPLAIVPAVHLWGGRGNGLMATWVMGAVAYLVVAHGYLRAVRPRHLLGILGFATAVGVVRFTKTGAEYDPILAILTTTGITVLIELCRSFHWPANVAYVIRKTAAYSFTLYLIHYTVLDIIRSAFGGNYAPWMLLAVGFVASNVLAAVLGLYTETVLTPKVKTWLYGRYAT